jgi:ribosome-associated protein
MTNDFERSYLPFFEALMKRKVIAPVALDVRKLTSIADVFIICSGRSSRQVSAIAEYVLKDLKEAGIRSIGSEGIREGQWALLDYGHVIIHIFFEPVRVVYDIEGLWRDAARIDLGDLKRTEETETSEAFHEE